MSKVPRISILLAIAVASLALCASAQAAIVTVGSPLTQVFAPMTASSVATAFNSTLTEAGANVVSPISGTVIRWHVLDASGGPFWLRVLRPATAGAYTGAGTSAAQTPSGLGLQAFASDLPIKAGDAVGFQNSNASDQLGVAPAPGAKLSVWEPPLAEGASELPGTIGEAIEVAFNAEVQPPPTLSYLNPNSGALKGATAVTIIGTDFTGATAVSFGGVPATSFSVQSETQISAVAPTVGAAGPVNVTVTTAAGTTTTSAADQFTYTAPAPTCTVPKLTGKKLKAAKKGLAKADCKFGKVTKLKGATAKTGKVVKQSPKAGKVLAPGSKVSVRLG